MYEGELFLSYFKKNGGVEYLPGGVESGFRDVTQQKEFVPRLLQIKGERYARVFPVDVTANSINDGDVFILDMNDKIYMWPGAQCNVNEKVKALEYCNNLRKFERHCKAEIVYPKDEASIGHDFWAVLGGKPAQINPPVPDSAEPEDDLQYSFYKVSDDSGKVQVSEIKERPLKVEMLDTNDCFILET